jgi:hypothetical protein
MTTNHLKTEVEPTPETSCAKNISETTENVQHIIPITFSSPPLALKFIFILSLVLVITQADRQVVKTQGPYYVSPVSRKHRN